MTIVNSKPSGLILMSDFFTEEEEKALLKDIDNCEWKDNRQKTRKVQIYGPYHNSSYKIIPGKFSEHPEWARNLAKKVCDSVKNENRFKLLDPKRCEIFVNQYEKLDELHYHFDHPKTYDENIYGISLNADSYVGFTKNGDKHKVFIPKRSMYIMSGDSRYKCRHGIDKGWIDGRRLSITFRTVKN